MNLKIVIFCKEGEVCSRCNVSAVFFSFVLLLGADLSASPSNQRHHSNDRLSIKFQFGKERVSVIDFIFPTQRPFAFLRNEFSLSPASIVKFVKRCFLSLREIASPILFDRSPFSFLKDADTGLFQGRKRCESLKRKV